VQVEANRVLTEAHMALRFVGIDPDTDLEHCPTVWADEEAGELVVQGWKANSVPPVSRTARLTERSRTAKRSSGFRCAWCR
jgi:hypothetical protein